MTAVVVVELLVSIRELMTELQRCYISEFKVVIVFSFFRNTNYLLLIYVNHIYILIYVLNKTR